MAIYTAGPIVGAISGTVGKSLTFAQGAGSNVLRRAASKTNSYSAPSLSRRAAYYHFARGWAHLTDAERATYQSAAEALTFPNALGVTRQLTAYQLYMKLNLIRWPGTTSIGGITGIPLALPAPIDAAASFTEGGPFTVTWTDPGGDVASIRFFGCRPVKDHATKSNYWRALNSDIVATAGTYNLYNGWTAILGNPLEDEVVRLRVVSFNSGSFYSPPIDLDVTIS